jgi:putative transposase
MSGFIYLVAVIDWFSRAVLAWRLSNTMDVVFCVDALDESAGAFREAGDLHVWMAPAWQERSSGWRTFGWCRRVACSHVSGL